MKDLSIVLNSRSPYLLDRMLSSFEVHTNNPNRFQIIINIDNDDIDSIEYSKQYKSNLNVVFEYSPRTKMLNATLTRLTDKYPAHYYWGLNDDVEINTYNWDNLLPHIDGYFKCFEGETNRGMACFPLMSHSLKNHIGFFVPPFIKNLYADNFLYEIMLERPDLIHGLDFQIIHYKERFPGWFLRTLDRQEYNLSTVDYTEHTTRNYKGKVRTYNTPTH